jgi:hypothetical protein
VCRQSKISGCLSVSASPFKKGWRSDKPGKLLAGNVIFFVYLHVN